MFSLKNKKAVVTGAGSGIGQAIAVLLAQQGAEVYVIEISEEGSMETVSIIQKEGNIAHAYSCDVSDHRKVRQTFDGIGAFDILINNAGIAHVGTVEQTTEEDFDLIMEVNVKGTYNCLHAALPHLKHAGGGVIVNMTSIAALVGIPERFAYSASKGAVRSMTMSVAKDYLGENIRCNSISPARIHTPFVDGFVNKNYPGEQSKILEKLALSQPIGRMGKAAEVAALALYLCADESAFITGCDYPIDGGFTTLNN